MSQFNSDCELRDRESSRLMSESVLASGEEVLCRERKFLLLHAFSNSRREEGEKKDRRDRRREKGEQICFGPAGDPRFCVATRETDRIEMEECRNENG